MLSGVMLIVITMFAVLGAYFLSEVLTDYVFKNSSAPKSVVVLANGSVEKVWNAVIEVRNKLPNCQIFVVCQNTTQSAENLQLPVKGVTFTTPENVGETINNALQIDLQKSENKL